MTMGAYNLFELIFIETYAPQFIGHNIFFLGSVDSKDSQECSDSKEFKKIYNLNELFYLSSGIN